MFFMSSITIDSSEQTISNILQSMNRRKLHLTSIFVAFFLGVYAQLVCPFIGSIPFSRIVITLVGIAIVQIGLREVLFRYASAPKENRSLARHGYYLSIATWFGTGIIAFFVHYYLYDILISEPAHKFPIGSHIKLLSGYWALGGGILAQWEYIDIEDAYRKNGVSNGSQRKKWEQITHRILESITIFTIVPVFTMLLIVSRYVYEGKQGIIVGPEMVQEVLFLGLFFVFTALAVSWRFGWSLRKDTEEIMDGISQVGEGNFIIDLDTSRPDEFGEVAKGINSMAQGLLQRERIREAFGHFVAPEVAKDFLEKYTTGTKSMLGGERKDLTILLCDLRDFTPLSESLEPEALTELLNEYFTEMVESVHTHGGIVDKFMGDAIMAIFGLIPHPEISHEEQAVAAALDMLKRVEVFNQKRLLHNPDAHLIRSGIGLHSGDVVAGYIGSKDRLEFTVIGQNVNLAARIEGQTKPPAPPLLFSQSVADKLGTDAIEVCSTHLKGVSEEVKLFSVRNLVSAEKPS